MTGAKAEETVESPAVSRSGRVIKQKKFTTDSPAGVGGGGDATVASSQPPRSNVDSQIEDPRKIWVKMKGSGDLIEINLDKDKPDRSVSAHCTGQVSSLRLTGQLTAPERLAHCAGQVSQLTAPDRSVSSRRRTGLSAHCAAPFCGGNQATPVQ